MNRIFIRCFSISARLNQASSAMKGILVREFGGPEVCRYETDIPIPEPNDDQIQIRVHAAGINPIDTYIRAGKHSRKPVLPYTPGFDSAGIVTKLGKNIKDLKIGDRVFTTDSDTGTYAEYALAQAKNTYKLVDNMSFAEGSAIGIPYFTAYKALFIQGDSQPGDTVLVHGASGSTGLASVQLAKSYGMRVIGTAGTQEGLDLVSNQGADHVFNHRETGYLDKIRSLHPKGVDFIMEMLANINLNNDLQLLMPKKGKIAIIGCRGPIEEEFQLMNHHLSALFSRNVFKPVIGRAYKLEEASNAHNDVINTTGATGRLTLIID